MRRDSAYVIISSTMGLSCTVFALLLVSAKGFSISNQHHHPASAIVQVHPVETIEDWNALADIRFDEWIREGGGTSRQAFRSATRDLYQEERPESVLLLAKQRHQEESANTATVSQEQQQRRRRRQVVVGAAEMSPYELTPVLAEDAPFSMLYVTDVVTSSQYRRHGIARTMMDDMEQRAIVLGISYLILNVASENAPAIQFYERLGYSVPTLEVLMHLDVPQLEEAAGTRGQIVLVKQLIDDTDADA